MVPGAPSAAAQPKAPALNAPALNVPKPSAPGLPKPSAVTSPPGQGGASPASPEPPAEENHDAHGEEAAGPRPIEYFYHSKVGNVAQVSFWISSAIAFGVTGIWYLFLWIVMAEDNYLRVLFMERSWVQYAETFLAAWTLGILILKVIHIRKQTQALSLDALPSGISPEINMYNVADFYDHVNALPRKFADTFLVRRMRKGLEYFYVRESNSEVASMMSSQSDIDANSISGSYSLAKVYMWAIPILGFIGTVLGIGAAIGDFAKTLANSTDPEAMMGGLQTVLGGMGTAFDTTFLALVLSILLMIPLSSIQASEEDVLNQVDESCNDHLIKRLNDGGAGAQLSDASAIRELGQVLEASNAKIVGKFSDIHGNMAQVYERQTEHYAKVAEAIDGQLKAMEQRAQTYEKRLDEDVSKSMATLAEGIRNLNEVLKDLNGKQIVVKKKLFGIF
jgi:biopolymer transport protein ExbB/TolQ